MNVLNKRKFSLKYGLVIIFLITVFMQIFLTVPAAAEEFFSQGIRDFIDAERKIYIPVFSTSSKIEIEVLEDSILKDSHTGEKIYQLDREKLFFVSRRNISQQKPGQTSKFSAVRYFSCLQKESGR